MSFEVIFILMVLLIMQWLNAKILLLYAFNLINTNDDEPIAFLPSESFLLYLRLLQPLFFLFNFTILLHFKEKKNFH